MGVKSNNLLAVLVEESNKSIQPMGFIQAKSKSYIFYLFKGGGCKESILFCWCQ